MATAVSPTQHRPSAPRLAQKRSRHLEQLIALAVVVIPFVATLAAIRTYWQQGVGWLEVGLLLFFYVATMLGVEVGFHRYFSHYAFGANRALQVLLAVLGSMAAQGPFLFWAAIHRRHHRYSDQPEDPHSPHHHGEGIVNLLRGVWHAHVGWLFVHDVPDWARYVPDLLRDPVLFRLNQMYLAFIALGLALPAAIGGLATGTWAGALSGLLWGGLVRIFLVHHAVWGVNSLCHLFGSRDYPTPDQSTNNAWLVVPSLGASWHNNHHAFLKSASLSFEWWQVDVHYYFIKVMQGIGWAKSPHLPNPELIRSRRLPDVLVDVITPTGQRA